MRCQCCDRNLNNYESTLRHPESGMFLDICMRCLDDIPITPVSNNALYEDSGFEDDVEYVVDFTEEDNDE